MTEQKKTGYIKKAEELVAKMTLEEAASQLSFDAVELPRLEMPAYNWWNEALHGVARAGTATSFPQAIALGALFDTELLHKIADAIASEGRAKYNAASAHGDRSIYKGLTFWSPNINIFRDPRWGRGHETYGEDPYLTARLGVAFVKGLQGDGETLKTAACAKHYAVHSGPESLRHEFNAECSAKDLWETYLPAFEACVREAEVEAVMGAYNRTIGEACCASNLLLVDILRGKWDFGGHVVSDCWALRDIYEHHKLVGTTKEAAALALKAGCDLNCGNVYSSLMEAHNDGLVTEEEIRRSAVRLMTTRYKLGILDGVSSEYAAIPFDVIDCPEHQTLNRQAASESVVLLKNNGLLPLDLSKYKNIAVIGPNADSRVALQGNYYGTSARYITLLEGLYQTVGGKARIHYAEGCKLMHSGAGFLTPPNNLLAEAIATAEHCDLTILALGLDETIEGEESSFNGQKFDGDKTDLMLPAPQRELLNAVIETGKPIVVVLLAGSAIDLRAAESAENAGGILCAWYPGGLGGLAIADVLLGEKSPCGKLPVTFYNSSDDLPEFTNYAMENRTYRYFSGDVLYPFGYGLTYGDAFVESARYSDGKITVTVTNKGRTTKDVIQVYVKADSEFAPVNPRLCAFRKLEFAAGSTGEVEIDISDEAFTVVNNEGERVTCSGKYTFYIGTGQPDARTAALSGHTSVALEIIKP